MSRRDSLTKGSSSGESTIGRRSMMKMLSATTGAVGLAGCTGGGDGGDGGGDGGDGGGDGSDGSTTGTPSDNGWPNLQGETVTFLSGEANQAIKTFYNRVKQDFEEETNATVEMNYGGGEAIDRTLVQRLQAGNPPEIFTAGAEDLYQMIFNDVARPLTDVYEDWVEEWGEPEQKHHLNYEGDEYLIPWDVHATAFHFREDVWDVGPNNNGEYPDTWDKWLSAAEDAHDPQGLRGCFVGASSTWCPQAILWGVGYSNSARIGDWNDGDPQIVADDYREEWLEAFEWIKSLHNLSLPAADAECAQYNNAYVGESVSASMYSGGRPKTSAVNQGVSWAGAARLMTLPYNTEQVVQGKPEGLMTFEGASDAGKEYIRFLGTAEDSGEYLKLLYETAFGHVMPAYPEIFEGPWQELATNEMIGEDKWHEEDVEQLRIIREDREWMHTSNLDSLRHYHGPVYGSYAMGDAQHNILINDADPAEEFDKAVDGLRQALDEAKSQA